MARKPRVHYEGALYHVICRGNNRKYVFEEAWKAVYLEILQHYKKKYGFKLYAYVVMDNHVHLLIEVNQVPLSKLLQYIQQVFTQRYNRSKGRTGHVFEQRYKAILCDKNAYLLMLIRYIHQNPVRVGKAEGLYYPWSSYREYITESKAGLIYTKFPLSLFDNRISQLRLFMEEPRRRDTFNDGPIAFAGNR